MSATMNQLRAPWSDEQVRSLNAYQKAGYCHPYTYGEGEKKVDLIATPAGWIAEEGGPVVQDWALADHANWGWWGQWLPSPLETAKALLAELEFVDGDDLCLPHCRFCGACGPIRNPAHPAPAEPHEPSCPLAALLERPTR